MLILTQMYPDVMAQCVYSTFIHAYPTSWNSFDEGFKRELCIFISLWQVGTKPLPNSWERWELSLLEPPNLLKHVVKDEQTSPKRDAKPPRRGTFNLDSLIKEAQKRDSVANESLNLNGQQENVSTATVADPSSRSIDVGGDKKIILLSDVERALISPSVSRDRLSPRSSLGSSKTTLPLCSDGSKEQHEKKEKAREQLSSLKKLLTDKASSQPALPSPKSPVQIMPRKRCSQEKQMNSSVKHAIEAKPTASPKQSVPSAPKPKLSVTGSQKGGSSSVLLGTPGKKGRAASVDKTQGAASAQEKKEEIKKTWKERALEICAKRKEAVRTLIKYFGSNFPSSL